MTAELQPFILQGPGVFGLNTDQAGPSIDPRWSLELSNAVFDESGRIAARKGWQLLTTTGGHSDDTEAVFEFIQDKDTSIIISAAGNALYAGTTTLTDETGTTTPTANNWQFVNYNGSVVGAQTGHVIQHWDGVAATFSDISATNRPTTGNSILSAFGRLWVTDTNEVTIHVTSTLFSLSAGDWTAAGTASINTAEVWPDGLDRVVGLAEFQNQLLVFGTRSILIYENPEDPNDASFGLVDIITAGGAVSRDSIVSVGNDLLYLAVDGLRSVARGIQFSTLPFRQLSSPVRQELVSDISGTPASQIKAGYSRTEGAYLTWIGTNFWYFDVREPIETGDLRASQWFGIGFQAIHGATDGTLYLGQNGGVAQYTGYLDDTETYVFRYRSTWLELEQGRTVIPKYARVTFVTTQQYAVNFKWAFGFIETFQEDTRVLMIQENPSEWNVAEWGLGEWSGGGSEVVQQRFELGGFGDRVQLGVTVVINGDPFAIQRIDLFHKRGRLAA